MILYTKQPKKMIIINILDILRKYTDENHKLSQKEIQDMLHSEYNMKVDRKAVKRNLMNLIDFGYEIEYSETVRKVRNRKTGEIEESSILSDFHILRDFTDGELRLLIDSLLFSKHIPSSQCKELIGKLEGLSSKYFKSRVKHIRTMPCNTPSNKQLFLTIEILDEAISQSKQVSFTYNKYGLDKTLLPNLNDDGTPKEYIVNPYQIVAANGRYYLIGNYHKYDDIAHYRLDRITNIKLLPTLQKPMKKVKGLENGLDLPRHMAEHIYMFTGKSDLVLFRAKKYLLNDIIDWFGSDITFFDETDEEITAKVTVNLMAMRRWALQYALHTRILSPQSLAEEVKKDIEAAHKNYKL
ncbi:MAG: helix-turn-helix transcriptional regulator [Caldicoprobacterales bacterium]|jgi:predicted DNA-binding transcriptional regulator YafY|nr:WYL domain-containing protein [Clostridiales bacterium]